VVLIVLTCMLAARANRSVDEIFSGASAITERVEEGTGQALERLAELRENVTKGQERWREGVEQVGERLTGDPERLAELRTRLAPLREWLALADGVGELVEVVEELLRSFGVLVGAEELVVGRLVLAVKQGRDRIAEATLAVGEIETALDVIRESPEAKEIQGKVDTAFVRVDGILEEIQGSVESFEELLGELAQSLDSLSAKIRGRIRLFTGIAIGFLGWQTAAQVCLCFVGWRMWGDGEIHES